MPFIFLQKFEFFCKNWLFACECKWEILYRQWGLNTKHWNTEHIRIPNTLEYQTFWGSHFQCFYKVGPLKEDFFSWPNSIIYISFSVAHYILQIACWSSEGSFHVNPNKMAAILFWFLMVLDKMAATLFKTEHHWKTACHWKTEQRVAIGIQNVFGFPAPTVFAFRTFHKDITKFRTYLPQSLSKFTSKLFQG